MQAKLPSTLPRSRPPVSAKYEAPCREARSTLPRSALPPAATARGTGTAGGSEAPSRNRTVSCLRPSNPIVPPCARRLSVSILINIAFTSSLHAQTPQPEPQARPEVRAFRVSRPPTVDGILDDEAWNQPAVTTTDWLSYNPLHGDRIPQRTSVWVA